MNNLLQPKLTLDDVPLEIYMSFYDYNGQPAILLRRRVFDVDLMRQIIEKYQNEEEIKVILKYNKSDMHFLMDLLNKGIVYKDNDKYVFTNF
jgi:hypothetical protein